MVPPTKLSRRPARALLFGGLAALLGCPAAPPTPEPAAPAASMDLLASPGDAATPPAVAPVEAEPRSLELGVLRQAAPTTPAPGSLYAIAELPLHTPPLQEGTEDDRRLVETYCVGCHSTTYISMQPPLSHERWEAEVKKMINVYGAVIPDPIAVRIATYLHAYYGNSPLPPRKRPAGPAAAASANDGAVPRGLDP